MAIRRRRGMSARRVAALPRADPHHGPPPGHIGPTVRVMSVGRPVMAAATVAVAGTVAVTAVAAIVEPTAGWPGVPAWQLNETPISVRPRPYDCFPIPQYQECIHA